uniref:Uncharacterized protein n=1 Tax=Arundo donax TaxID=35708 RepID=A0A0A9HKX8_ARUDO
MSLYSCLQEYWSYLKLLQFSCHDCQLPHALLHEADELSEVLLCREVVMSCE